MYSDIIVGKTANGCILFILNCFDKLALSAHNFSLGNYQREIKETKQNM